MTEKTIIVTGASGGIGKRTAETFLNAGWRVGLIGRREDALNDIAASSGNALALPCPAT